MHEKKTFAMAEVRTTESENPNGEFEVILSAETVDRDGEIIDAKAFEPLPDSIPFHAFHDFHDPIGRGVPFYDGNVLKARGVFASTPRAQEVRTLVAEGVIGHTSVGFMAAVRKDGEDAPHVTSGELLEGSFVSVPSNREAAVLMAKEYDANAGQPSPAMIATRVQQVLSQDPDAVVTIETGSKSEAEVLTKATKGDRLQSIHDLAVQNGAVCATKCAHPEVSTDAPAAPASEEAGKSPASNVVEMARIRANIARLSVTD